MENLENGREGEERKLNSVEASNKELMTSILNELGCSPYEEEDGSYHLMFQGEHFVMEFCDLYVQIWDPSWSHVNVNDLNLPIVKLAMNLANFAFGPTLLISEPNDEGNLIIHTRYGIVLHPAIPQITNYVRETLKMFFRAKETMHHHYVSLVAKQNTEG